MIKYLIALIFMHNISCQPALVIKPVIDLIPQKMSTLYSNLSYYDQIPLSSVAKIDLKTCPRVHQLLFNEIVEVIKIDNKEVIIQLPNIFYQTIGSNKKNNTFWTLKDNLIFLDNLDQKYIDLNKIPKDNPHIATLIFPFEDEITKKTYSAGTKFVYSVIDGNETDFLIYIFDPKTLSFKESRISKDFCITKEYVNHITKQKKIANFVHILQKWANLKYGFIPYVWGGYSFCDISEAEKFTSIEKAYEKTKLNYFHYTDFKKNPKTGFDCSNLALAAAQIAGIPFYFKNTTTILQNLKALNKNEQINQGDLIWIPGHIIIITDLKNNLCVEARGYLNNGYGKVHEISLNQLFKDLNNFDDLVNAFHNKKTIYRLDKLGNIFENISNFKILKIESCWT